MAVTLLNSGSINDLRDEVARRVGPNRYRTWFGDHTEFALKEQTLTVCVRSHFVASWIASNHLPDIEEAARTVFGPETHVPVRIVAQSILPGEAEAATPIPALPPARTERPALKAAVPATTPLPGELERFVVGAANQLAYSAALAMADGVGRTFGLLLLFGGCGLGKTHLIQGICNRMRSQQPTATWRYVSGEEFTNEYIAAVKAGNTDAFRARYRGVDLLAIDDIHFLENKRATQDEFFHTYNAINASGKVVVLTSDRHPRGLASFSEPLINRLVAGMVVEVGAPDFETRRKILEQRRGVLGCRIDDLVLDYLARNISSNVRELEGALTKLALVARTLHQPITLELAQAHLRDLAQRRDTPLNCAGILQHVASHFGLTPEQIHSRSRDRTVALARGLAIYLVRKHCTMSYPEMGRAIGGKNHSTIVMAYQRIEELVRGNLVVRWKRSGQDLSGQAREVLGELESGLLCGAA